MALCQVEARFLGSIHVRVNGVSRLTNESVDTIKFIKRDLFENGSFWSWQRILACVHVAYFRFLLKTMCYLCGNERELCRWGFWGGGGGGFRGGFFLFFIYIFIFLWHLQLQLLPFATQQIKTRKRLETEPRKEETLQLRRASWQYVRRCEEKTTGLKTTIRGRKGKAIRLKKVSGD